MPDPYARFPGLASGDRSSGRASGHPSQRGAGRRRARPRPTPVQRYQPPVQASSSGRYSAPAPPPSSRGGGGGGPVPQIKAEPPPPSLGQFLGKDASYQNQLRQLARTLSSFKSDATRRQGILQSESKDSMRALAKQRGMDLENIEEDFGSRGLLKSGLYAEELGDYESEYGERTSDISTQLKRALAQLKQELGGARSKYKLSRQEAREAAVERRAAKYGL